MTVVLPVASGKGGVGKSVLSANLGVALARAGKAVVLVDLDLGGSNLHTVLGMRNKYAGVGHYITKQEDSIEALLLETEVKRLFFVPGDALLPGTANLPFFRKQRMIKELSGLPADFVILDLGSGSSYNTIDFFLTTSSGLVVCTFEPTSILNAYSFLKTALFRLIYRSFPAKSEERKVIEEFGNRKLEGSSHSFQDLPRRLRSVSAESADRAEEQLAAFAPRVVLNMGRSSADLQLGARLRGIVRKNLGLELEYAGVLPYDEEISRSVLERRPDILRRPDSRFAYNVDQIARKLIDAPVLRPPVLYEEDEDLRALSRQLASD